MSGDQKSEDTLKLEVVSALQKTVDCFRQGSDEQGYLNMLQLMQPLEELINMVARRENAPTVMQINANLSEALQAMEQGDPLLLADYLEYGVLPSISEL